MAEPQQAATPEVGFADRRPVLGTQRAERSGRSPATSRPITRRINGGLNGQAERPPALPRAGTARAGAGLFPAAAPAPAARDGASSRAAGSRGRGDPGSSRPQPPESAAGARRGRAHRATPIAHLRRPPRHDRLPRPAVPAHADRGADPHAARRLPRLRGADPRPGTEGACTGFGLATVANYLLLAPARDPGPRAGQRAHAVRAGAALRRMAGRGLRRLERARCDEGLAQARRLQGGVVPVDAVRPTATA